LCFVQLSITAFCCRASAVAWRLYFCVIACREPSATTDLHDCLHTFRQLVEEGSRLTVDGTCWATRGADNAVADRWPAHQLLFWCALRGNTTGLSTPPRFKQVWLVPMYRLCAGFREGPPFAPAAPG
jgi:hypothetical protein